MKDHANITSTSAPSGDNTDYVPFVWFTIVAPSVFLFDDRLNIDLLLGNGILLSKRVLLEIHLPQQNRKRTSEQIAIMIFPPQPSNNAPNDPFQNQNAEQRNVNDTPLEESKENGRIHSMAESNSCSRQQQNKPTDTFGDTPRKDLDLHSYNGGSTIAPVRQICPIAANYFVTEEPPSTAIKKKQDVKWDIPISRPISPATSCSALAPPEISEASPFLTYFLVSRTFLTNCIRKNTWFLESARNMLKKYQGSLYGTQYRYYT